MALQFPLAALLLLGLFSCPPPGEGARAERGYAQGVPILHALARYHADSAAYPDALARLAPQYLTAADLAPPNAPEQDYPWEYERAAAHFILRFRYSGPGLNSCSYDSRSARWSCSGLF